MISALYAGVVTHARHRAPLHRLRYRLVQALFDLEELPELARRLTLFSHNRPGLVSFRDRDHGDGSGDLVGWVRGLLKEAGIAADGRIALFCMPRMLGYAFNPLSVYFCHDGEGRLRALLYQVNNTFGQRHSYLLPVEAGEGETVRQTCDKGFHVSPFLPMGLHYDFAVKPPGETTVVKIVVSDPEGLVLDAVFAGERRPLSDSQLLAALLAYPLMTLKVIVGIHWEALKMWIKGARYHPVPPAPATPVSMP